MGGADPRGQTRHHGKQQPGPALGRITVSVHRKCLKAETDRVAEIGIFDNET